MDAGWLMEHWPWAAGIGGGLAFITTVAEAWRRWLGPLTLGGVHLGRDATRRLIAAAELTEAQLNTNGGGSLIDKVDGLIEKSGESALWQKGMDRRMKAGDGRFDTLDMAVAGIEKRLGAVEDVLSGRREAL